MIYFITGGNTFPIRKDLTAFKCTWDADKKRWSTPPLEKKSLTLKRLKSLCMAVGADIYPEKLEPECQKIQDVLNK